MGLFSRKEKSPEEKLVNELVGTGFSMSKNLTNLRKEGITSVEMKFIKDNVISTWKNGKSVLKIQKAYDQTLREFLAVKK